MAILEYEYAKLGHPETHSYKVGDKYETKDEWDAGPNSAGGIGVAVKFYNASGRTIKYVKFHFMPYNSVNDVVESSIGGTTEAGCTLTGPINPEGFAACRFEDIWYNPTITNFKIPKIEVQFMDDTIEEFVGDEWMYCYDENSQYAQKHPKLAKMNRGAQKILDSTPMKILGALSRRKLF